MHFSEGKIEVKLNLRLFSLVAAVAGMLATAQSAYADRVEVGFLKCEVEGGIGFVFGSTKALDCVFYKQGGRTEAYGGRINKFGVDLGVTAGGVIAWSVLALTSELPPGELAGNFAGANAEVSAGLGGGVDLLVGGSRDTVVLQPLSVKGQVGINFAVGVAQIKLYPLFGGKDTWRPRTVSAPARTQPPARFFAEEPNYGCGSYYILRSGETLSMISRICGVEVATLLKANPNIANVRDLPVGLAV